MEAAAEAVGRKPQVRAELARTSLDPSVLTALAGAGQAEGQPPQLIGASPLVLETLRLSGLERLLA